MQKPDATVPKKVTVFSEVSVSTTKVENQDSYGYSYEQRLVEVNGNEGHIIFGSIGNLTLHVETNGIGVNSSIYVTILRQHLYGVGLRFCFGPKSRFKVKYFCVHMSHLCSHQDCLNVATNLNLRHTSIVGNLLPWKFNVTAAFKADVIIRSVNKI